MSTKKAGGFICPNPECRKTGWRKASRQKVRTFSSIQDLKRHAETSISNKCKEAFYDMLESHKKEETNQMQQGITEVQEEKEVELEEPDSESTDDEDEFTRDITANIQPMGQTVEKQPQEPVQESDSDNGCVLVNLGHDSSDDDNEKEERGVEDDSVLKYKKPEGFGPSYLLKRLGTTNPLTGKKHMDYEANTGKMNAETLSDVHLLHILEGSDINLFQKVRQWRYDSDHHYDSKVDQQDKEYAAKKKQRVIDHIGDTYGMCEDLSPQVLKVMLPWTKVEVELVRFPFGDILVSLLTDPVGMRPENLLVDMNDPFKIPKYGGEDGYLDDIDTGQV
jgi:hypothetical protein